MIRQLLRIVELTVPEQRVVIFALTALVAFVALKTCRDAANDVPRDESGVVADQPSPSPGIRP